MTRARCSILAVLLLAAVALPPGALAAGPGEAGPATAEVRAVSVDWGAGAPLTPAELEAASGIAPGAAVSPARLAEAIRRLVALPQVRWAGVRTEPAGPGRVAVFFRLARTLHLDRVVVSGARRLGADAVEGAARLVSGVEVDPPRLDQVRDRVLKLYADHGYFDAKVTVASVPAGAGARPDQVNVRIAVAEGRRATVESVRFTGLPPEAGSGPWRRSLRTEGPFDAGALGRDMGRMEKYLTAKGYLNPQVGPYVLDRHGRGVAVTIPVQVRDRVELRIVDSGPLSGKAVRRLLNLTGQRSLDPAVVDEARDRVRSTLRDQGYREAEVKVDVTHRPDAPVYDVRVDIHAGPRHRVAEVRFDGNLTFTADELNDLVKPGFRIRAEPVREGVIQERAGRVEGALRAAGFPDAAITYTIAPAPGVRHRDVVTYHVDEGSRWWVDAASLAGTDDLPEAARAAAEGPIRALVGSPYRRDRLRAARADVETALGAHGYVDAAVDTDSAPRDVWRGKVGPGGVPLREVLVDLTFRVTPGPQVHVGRVTVGGTFRTRPYVVERELTVHPGDVLSPEALAETRRRLFRAASFDRVQVGPADPDDHSDVRDVAVHLTEGKPGAVEFGIGYAEEDGVRGLIDLSYRDLFRRGQRANLQLRYGQLRRSVILGHVLPWIGPYRIGLHTRLLYEREDLISYDRVTWAVESGIRRPVMKDVVFTLTYRLERNRFPRLPADQVAAVAERRRIAVGSVFGSLVRDTRDDPFSPRRGTVVGATYEQGARALASQVQFAKFTVQAAEFVPVGRNVVLAGKVQTGRVMRLFDSTQVPVSERFFMGGQSSVRGYALDSVGVPGETLVSGVPQGGLILILSNLELRFGGRTGWGFVLFADAGNVWNYASTIGVQDFRAGAGPGLEYETPVGPLRLDLGYKIDPRPGESAYRVHFTLGHTF